MADSRYTVLVLFCAGAAGLYWLLYRWRYGTYAHIPSPLKNNIFIGHLGYIAAEFKKSGNSQMHPDYALQNIWKQNGRPDVLYIDTRPAQWPIALICSHEVAEQVSRATKLQPYSITKSPTVQNFRQMIGRMSLLSVDGEEWKMHRKRFNPGFAPQHVFSLMPVIVEKTRIFMKRLDALADSGVATEMESYCTDVTFDIITEVVTNVDCKAQDETVETHEMIKYFQLLSSTYVSMTGLVPDFLNLPKHYKRYINGKRLDAAVKKTIQEKWNSTQSGEKLTPPVLQSISDQVKTFLLAGHDTTSILLQRVIYALSIDPQCLAKIRAEHDAVFGNSDPGEVMVARPEETMKALPYTSACIKEALRLWPPAGTARMSHNGFKVRTTDGNEICIDECVIYPCHYIIHRDERVYGPTANEFVPERWMNDLNTTSENKDEDGSATGEGRIPVSAWRAFERGPRNCIGQELANLEARAILSCVMRRYDFVKVGIGEVETDNKGNPVIDEKGRFKTKSELLSTMSITSKPIDHTVMRVKLHQPIA